MRSLGRLSSFWLALVTSHFLASPSQVASHFFASPSQVASHFFASPSQVTSHKNSDSSPTQVQVAWLESTPLVSWSQSRTCQSQLHHCMLCSSLERCTRWGYFLLGEQGGENNGPSTVEKLRKRVIGLVQLLQENNQSILALQYALDVQGANNTYLASTGRLGHTAQEKVCISISSPYPSGSLSKPYPSNQQSTLQ